MKLVQIRDNEWIDIDKLLIAFIGVDSIRIKLISGDVYEIKSTEKSFNTIKNHIIKNRNQFKR